MYVYPKIWIIGTLVSPGCFNNVILEHLTKHLTSDFDRSISSWITLTLLDRPSITWTSWCNLINQLFLQYLRWWESHHNVSISRGNCSSNVIVNITSNTNYRRSSNPPKAVKSKLLIQNWYFFWSCRKRWYCKKRIFK